MERTSFLRGGSLLIAVGALSALVLHACASTESMAKQGATPSMQQAAADPGTTENGAATSPNATASPPAPTNDDDDHDDGPYMPATKAGPGIVIQKQKHATSP